MIYPIGPGYMIERIKFQSAKGKFYID